MVGEANLKPQELCLPGQIVNQKQYYVSGEILEISENIKGLTFSGVVILTTLHSAYLFCL